MLNILTKIIKIKRFKNKNANIKICKQYPTVYQFEYESNRNQIGIKLVKKKAFVPRVNVNFVKVYSLSKNISKSLGDTFQ